MAHIILPFEWKGVTFQVDLNRGHCIAIPLDHTHPQPNAFFAPLYEATPHKAGDWIGDTREGSPVNFFNLRINPHGNGTHTECVGHITKERYSVHETLGDGFWVAQLISVYGGVLAAHRAFWQYPGAPRFNATITEMVYVDNVIPDGLYLLQIQIPALELDASPSRPYIYPLR